MVLNLRASPEPINRNRPKGRGTNQYPAEKAGLVRLTKKLKLVF